jgi:ABC-type transport system involved in Fe-S cluster assembly fused permease/ATPase subunit
MITAFVLFLLVVIVLAVGLVSGVAVLALRLTFSVVRLVFQILFLPFALIGRSRRDPWRRERWRRREWRRGAW